MSTIYQMAKKSAAKKTQTTTAAAGGETENRTPEQMKADVAATKAKYETPRVSDRAEKIIDSQKKFRSENYQNDQKTTAEITATPTTNRGVNAAGVSNPSYVNSKSQRIFQYDPETGKENPAWNPNNRDESYEIKNSPEQSAPVERPNTTLRDEELTYWQNERDLANNRAAAAEADRDKIFTASMEKFQNFYDLQKTQFSALETKIGAQNFPEIQEIIGGIEESEDSPVILSENFIASAEKIATQFANDPEKKREFLTDLARNNALKYKTPEEKAQWSAATENAAAPEMMGGANGENAAALGMTPAAGGMEAASFDAPAKSSFEMISDFNPSATTGQIAAMMNDPNTTAGEILSAILNINVKAQNDANNRTQELLSESIQTTKASEKRWTTLFTTQADESRKILETTADIEKKKLELKKEQLFTEKTKKVSDLNEKYANFAGFNKSLLKSLGLSGGSYEANALAVSTQKVVDLIANTEQQYDFKIEEIDNGITEINMNLAANIIKIGQERDQNLLKIMDASDEDILAAKSASLKSANETEISNASSLGDFANAIMAEKEKAQNKADAATKEAQAALKEKAAMITDGLGISHILDDDGNIIPLTFEGKTILTPSAAKEARDAISDALSGPDDFAKFDEWERKTTAALEVLFSAGKISEESFENAKKEISEYRQSAQYQMEKANARVGGVAAVKLPLWEDIATDDIAAKYGATKAQTAEIKKKWIEVRDAGGTMAQFEKSLGSLINFDQKSAIEPTATELTKITALVKESGGSSSDAKAAQSEWKNAKAKGESYSSWSERFLRGETKSPEEVPAAAEGFSWGSFSF